MKKTHERLEPANAHAYNNLTKNLKTEEHVGILGADGKVILR
jgi:hypothetical protein